MGNATIAQRKVVQMAALNKLNNASGMNCTASAWVSELKTIKLQLINATHMVLIMGIVIWLNNKED